MRCPIEVGNGAEILVALAAGRLTPEEQKVFELHLAECAECRRLADAQRSVWSVLDAWKSPAVSEDFDSSLFARIAAEEQRPWWRRRWGFSWRPMLPVGAACLALVGVFLLHNPWPQTVVPAAPTTVIRTQEDAQKVDVDQVERALDDMDMLKQLDTPGS
ncbi:MAG: zf-HC2 domain-containing protein [Bryobacteraceae bacterium]|jgi:anti-sigma factor RsiW